MDKPGSPADKLKGGIAGALTGVVIAFFIALIAASTDAAFVMWLILGAGLGATCGIIFDEFFRGLAVYFLDSL